MDENQTVGQPFGPEPMISEEEAAKIVGRSRQWLRDMRLSGEGPMFIDMGRSVLYYPSDVRMWLHSRRRAPEKQVRKPRAKRAAKKALDAKPAAPKAANAKTSS